jgi:hypothetical protein
MSIPATASESFLEMEKGEREREREERGDDDSLQSKGRFFPLSTKRKKNSKKKKNFLNLTLYQLPNFLAPPPPTSTQDSTRPTSRERSRSTTPSASSPSRRPTRPTPSASAAALPRQTASASARSATRAGWWRGRRSTTSTRPSPASSMAEWYPLYLTATATGQRRWR